MTQPLKDSFLDLERHRRLLEENVEKLRKSLQHWQMWEAEYEGLKEEILAIDPPPTRAQLLSLAQIYEGDLVTPKEVGEIIGPESRDVAHVVNILDRRIDYVEQNVRTIQKQIGMAENRLAAATIVSTPDVRNEEGLPLTDIVEELDDDGNVISSHVSTPGSAKPQLLEVLKKAGVPALPAPDTSKSAEAESTKPSVDATVPHTTRKVVTFAESTQPGQSADRSQISERLEEIMERAKQSEKISSQTPVIPQDESPEDAALRREMIQYGMSEVGAVVAELDLEEISEYSSDGEDEEDSSDEEDEFGRSTRGVIDDELRKRMIELENRLGVRMMENIGQQTADENIVREGMGRVTISEREEVPSADELPALEQDSSPDRTTKKSVRFSENLDVSPAPRNETISNTSNTPNDKRFAAPIGDVIERVAPAASTKTPPSKTSRFRAAIPANSNLPNASDPSEKMPSNTYYDPRIAPSGPEGKTLASAVVERDVSSIAAEPDEFDPDLLRQEVASDYHRRRNRMIQKQGGFLKDEETEIVPFTEEEGGPKKVSRFKAARLAKS